MTWHCMRSGSDECIYILEGSSMRLMVPETYAALLGIINSKPSFDANVTYSAASESRNMLYAWDKMWISKYCTVIAKYKGNFDIAS